MMVVVVEEEQHNILITKWWSGRTRGKRCPLLEWQGSSGEVEEESDYNGPVVAGWLPATTTTRESIIEIKSSIRHPVKLPPPPSAASPPVIGQIKEEAQRGWIFFAPSSIQWTWRMLHRAEVCIIKATGRSWSPLDNYSSFHYICQRLIQHSLLRLVTFPPQSPPVCNLSHSLTNRGRSEWGWRCDVTVLYCRCSWRDQRLYGEWGIKSCHQGNPSTLGINSSSSSAAAWVASSFSSMAWQSSWSLPARSCSVITFRNAFEYYYN